MVDKITDNTINILKTRNFCIGKCHKESYIDTFLLWIENHGNISTNSDINIDLNSDQKLGGASECGR